MEGEREGGREGGKERYISNSAVLMGCLGCSYPPKLGKKMNY